MKILHNIWLIPVYIDIHINKYSLPSQMNIVVNIIIIFIYLIISEFISNRQDNILERFAKSAIRQK